MPTPTLAPYKLAQRSEREVPEPQTRASLKRAAIREYRDARVVKTVLPGGAEWWPALAPLNERERDSVRVVVRFNA